MGVIKQKAPQKRDLVLPVCGGCDKCGDLHPDHLYALGYNKKYYCKECFHRMAVKWPKPEPYKEPYKRARVDHGEEAVQEVSGSHHVQDRGQRGFSANDKGGAGELEVPGRD